MIEGSLDGVVWHTLVDKSKNFKDVPHDYVELAQPEQARFIRYRNIHVPTPHLSLSGLRVFGLGDGKAPAAVEKVTVNRRADRRDALVTWDARTDAQGYVVRWGIAPDKLYSSWMVYETSELELKGLTVDQPYHFTVEAFNENGVAAPSKLVSVD